MRQIEGEYNQMGNDYNLDDILAEIKQKKAQKQSGTEQNGYDDLFSSGQTSRVSEREDIFSVRPQAQPAQPVQQPRPQAPVQPQSRPAAAPQANYFADSVPEPSAPQPNLQEKTARPVAGERQSQYARMRKEHDEKAGVSFDPPPRASKPEMPAPEPRQSGMMSKFSREAFADGIEEKPKEKRKDKNKAAPIPAALEEMAFEPFVDEPPVPEPQKPGKKGGFQLNITEEQLDSQNIEGVKPFDFSPPAQPAAPKNQATRMDLPVYRNMREGAEDDSTMVMSDEQQLDILEQTSSLEKSRMKKAQAFELDRSFEEGMPADGAQQQEEESDLDDFESFEDTKSILHELGSIKISLLARLAVSGVCFIILAYLALCLTYPLPLPKMIWPETDMGMFIMANLAVTVVAALTCSTTVGGGLMSLLTLKADNDSPVALAVLSTVVMGVALVVQPDKLAGDSIHIYFAIAVLALVFNSLGKLMMMQRISKNFRFVASPKHEKYAILQLKDPALAREFARGLEISDSRVVYPAKANFLSGFLEQSYSEDFSENLSRMLTPICLVASVVVSAVVFLVGKDIFAALTTFSALLCICAPLTATVVGNLPLLRASKALSKSGGMVAGYSALEDFSEANIMVLNAADLFTPGCITLHGIKAFRPELIDQAIVDAASVMCKTPGTLSEIFLQLINGDEKLLKTVDSMVYEDSMGMSAWVNSKRVLIGNRELMRNHGIELPSREYEAKFTKDGRQLLYLANSGELIGMYVLSYQADEAVREQLDELAEQNISLIVYTTDPNITAAQIVQAYDYPEDCIKILPGKLHTDYTELTSTKDRAKAAMACIPSTVGMLKTFLAAGRTRQNIQLGTILQLGGIVLGYALITFLTFMGNMGTASFLNLLIYQLVWTLLCMAIPAIKRL